MTSKREQRGKGWIINGQMKTLGDGGFADYFDYIFTGVYICQTHCIVYLKYIYYILTIVQLRCKFLKLMMNINS